MLHFRNVRWGISVDVSFERDSPDGSPPAQTPARFVSRHDIAININDFDEQFAAAIQRIISEIDMFTSHGSGWNIIGILNVTVQCAHYDSIRGSSFIPTPSWLKKKRAVVNVLNENDDYCFLYSVLAHKYPPKNNANQPSHYRKYILDMKSKGLLNGLQWPLPIKQIPIFERMNPEFSINVMYADPDETGHKITPLYASKHRGREQTVFLLLLTEPVEKENEEEELALGSRDNFNGLRLHYVLVRNTSALFNDVTNHQHKTHLCPYCFHRYSTACLLKAHVERCSVHAPCSIRFPSKWRKTNATKRKRAEMEGEGESEQEGVEDLLEIDSDVKKAALEKQKSNRDPRFYFKISPLHPYVQSPGSYLRRL